MGKKSTTRHVNHCSKTLSDGGVVITRLINKAERYD